MISFSSPDPKNEFRVVVSLQRFERLVWRWRCAIRNKFRVWFFLLIEELSWNTLEVVGLRVLEHAQGNN